MLTGAQVRAARHSLRWTVQELAASAGVSVSTIKRIEVDDGVPSTSSKNLSAVKVAFEGAGIEFIGAADNAPGIRIHARPRAL